MAAAVIIGTGPNGLAAGIRLAQTGLSVTVYDKEDTLRGATRTKELPLHDFYHDVCSAIHPMAKASPFLKNLPLNEYGLEWIHPHIPLAHPLYDQPPAALFRSFEQTTAYLEED